MNYFKSLILVIFLFLYFTTYGQQPFEEDYGYKVKIATLSKGKYVEFFDQDSLVQIGSIVINRKTGKLVFFVTYDTTYSEATLKPDLISRWMSPDPLASEFYSYSPYNFTFNNPIKFVDPDGRAASPYYDQDGNFLGVDEKGFEGEIYVTNKETYDKNSTNGVADSKSIQSDQNTVGLQDAGLSAQGLSNVYTDVLAQGGYDVSKLGGDAISVNNGPNDKFNDPSEKPFLATTPSPPLSEMKISVNQGPDAKADLTTVENVQNALGAHEYRGHGEKRYGYANEVGHYKAYEEQMRDPTWEKTTPSFRSKTVEKYRMVLRKNNGDLFYQKFPMERRRN